MKRNTFVVVGIIIAVAVGALVTLQVLRDSWGLIEQRATLNLLATCDSFNASWDDIKRAVNTCQVVQGVQLHNLTVGAKLKDGRALCAKEPEIDAIFDEARAAHSRCGRTPIATE